MFCHNCGKQIPDGTKFCHYCGAPQEAGSQPEPEPSVQSQFTEPQPEPQPKKKSPVGMIIAAAVIVVLILGVFVIAPAMQGSQGEGGCPQPNSVEVMEFGLKNPTLEFFVMDRGDGTLQCCDYAAEGDTLAKYYETVFLDLTSMSEEQKESTVERLTEQFENWRLICDIGFFSEDGSWSLSEIKKEITDFGFISMYK